MSSAQRWRLVAGGLLAAVLFSLFLRGVDWRGLLAALGGARPGYLVGVVLATLASYLVRAWRWGYLLAPLGRVSFPRLFSATMVGFMSGQLVPRAGEIVRPYLVSRSDGVPTSAGFATIILERLVDLITVLVLFALYLYVLPTPAAQTRGPLLGVLRAAGILTGVGALLVGMVLLAFHRHADRAMAVIDRQLARLPSWMGARLSRAMRAFGEGLAVLQAPGRHLLAIQAQSILLWLTIALAFYWNNAAFRLDLPFHSTFLLIAFLTVGVAIPTPGTVGGFHAFYLAAMTEAFGVDRSIAAAAALCGHALSNLPVLVLGLFFLGRGGMTLGKLAAVTEAGGQPPESQGSSAGPPSPREPPLPAVPSHLLEGSEGAGLRSSGPPSERGSAVRRA